MKIVVLKFGGTSVGTISRIKKVAKIITSYIKKKYKVIVVSSAMSGVTYDLVTKSKNICEDLFLKVRARQIPINGCLQFLENHQGRVILDDSAHSVAKGQGCVFYNKNDQLLGGGWII